MSKLPSFQFYPGDWLKDPAVRSVSLSARGLWIDMLCLMHESDRRGYLQHVTGKPVTAQQLARMTGCSTGEVSRLLQELQDSGVFSCTDNGVIYSRRIVRDEKIRQKRSDAGRIGAQYGCLGAEFGSLGGRPKNPAKTPQITGQITRQKTRQKPPPSSSSSSSSSNKEERRNTKEETRKAPSAPPRALTRTLALSDHSDLQSRFERFWSAYPRHEAKQAAWKAFQKLSPDDDLVSVMIRWIGLARDSAQWQDRQFIPHASTWLNQRRWESDPPPSAGKSYQPDTVGQPPEGDAQLSPEFAEALAAKANQLFGALEVDEKT